VNKTNRRQIFGSENNKITGEFKWRTNYEILVRPGDIDVIATLKSERLNRIYKDESMR